MMRTDTLSPGHGAVNLKGLSANPESRHFSIHQQRQLQNRPTDKPVYSFLQAARVHLP
jgi:hypothetical protein